MRTRMVSKTRMVFKGIYQFLQRTLGATLIDRPARIDTAGNVRLEELGLAGEGRTHYEPSGWLDLRRVLRRQDVSDQDVFLDLGSGKGRVLLAAARYPFRRVIGVELSAELNAIAERNVDSDRGRHRCGEVELVTADVLDYEIPDDVTFVYAYNPFMGDLFAAVIEKLLASVDRRPRKLQLIYKTALEEPRLLATGRFRRVKVARGLRPGRAWSQKMAIRMYVVETTPLDKPAPIPAATPGA